MFTRIPFRRNGRAGAPEIFQSTTTCLARLLKVKPSDFLRLAYADEEASAPNRLEDWVGEPKPPYARKKPLPLAPEHEERMRELIREELAKAKG